MALIHCSECGKEISSLATACPSCGAPPPSIIVPSPLPTQARPASRTKQFILGAIALLTGAVLILVIRGVTHQLNTSSVATSPTPITTESAMTSSPSVETASQSSPSLAAAETPSAESATTSSPPVETASQSSPSLAAAETPYASDESVATPPTPPRPTYQVIGVPQGEYLNVRGGAGSDYQVVTELEPGTGGILLGTKRVANGATTWQEITVHGQTGWVNAAYIALEPRTPMSPTQSPAESSTPP